MNAYQYIAVGFFVLMLQIMASINSNSRGSTDWVAFVGWALRVGALLLAGYCLYHGAGMLG